MSISASKIMDHIALETQQNVERAIIPLYALSVKSQHHKLKKETLEQIGTGILIKIDTDYFIFTCTHVFEYLGQYALCVGQMGGGNIKQLIEERFSKGYLNDQFSHKSDASVYHIQSELSDVMKNNAIGLEDLYLDYDNIDLELPVYLAIGFRSKKSRKKGNVINCKIEAFPSNELPYSLYKSLNCDRSNFFLFHYPDRIINNDFSLANNTYSQRI